MDSITLRAYAKVNLCLDVTGRRADGYHLLETVMHTVSLCDIITLEKRSGGISVECTKSDIPLSKENIAYRCAEAFYRLSGIEGEGISIAIDKRIPVCAGLGGGSADGAAVFKGMNALYGAGLSEDSLCAAAADIGADIPFCIKGGCGYCTGIGERIEPLPPLSGYLLIGKGDAGISTREAYGRIDAAGVGIGMENVKKAFTAPAALSDIAPFCRNIFEEVSDIKEVAYIKELMKNNGAICASMTGSGSAVFGIYETSAKAQTAAAVLCSNGFYAKVCEFVG